MGASYSLVKSSRRSFIQDFLRTVQRAKKNTCSRYHGKKTKQKYCFFILPLFESSLSIVSTLPRVARVYCSAKSRPGNFFLSSKLAVRTFRLCTNIFFWQNIVSFFYYFFFLLGKVICHRGLQSFGWFQ